MKQLADFAVGDTFRSVRRVDPLRPVCYAAASGDFNPIHNDDDEPARPRGRPRRVDAVVRR